jgi:hypothetical protein
MIRWRARTYPARQTPSSVSSAQQLRQLGDIGRDASLASHHPLAPRRARGCLQRVFAIESDALRLSSFPHYRVSEQTSCQMAFRHCRARYSKPHLMAARVGSFRERIEACELHFFPHRHGGNSVEAGTNKRSKADMESPPHRRYCSLKYQSKEPVPKF